MSDESNSLLVAGVSMITRIFLAIWVMAVLSLGCEPETFHARLGSGQPAGAAGTGVPAGAGIAGTTGSGTGAAGIPALPPGDAGTGGDLTGLAGANGGAAGTGAAGQAA